MPQPDSPLWESPARFLFSFFIQGCHNDDFDWSSLARQPWPWPVQWACFTIPWLVLWIIHYHLNFSRSFPFIFLCSLALLSFSFPSSNHNLLSSAFIHSSACFFHLPSLCWAQFPRAWLWLCLIPIVRAARTFAGNVQELIAYCASLIMKFFVLCSYFPEYLGLIAQFPDHPS